jgi:hypothetical protein
MWEEYFREILKGFNFDSAYIYMDPSDHSYGLYVDELIKNLSKFIGATLGDKKNEREV